MAKEIIEIEEGAAVKPSATEEFGGYTLEELRYQRALLALRKEFSKTKMLHQVNRLREGGLTGNKSGKKTAMVGSLASKLLSGLSYVDYALMGYSVFGTGRKIFKFFRRKK